MKLLIPDYLTPARWIKAARISLSDPEHLTADGYQDGVAVEFDAQMDEQGHVTIANHGRMRICMSGDRQVDWRRKMERQFGVQCELATKFTGKLICPHTGREIVKSRIVDNPVLWGDKEHHLASRCNDLMYWEPDGVPAFHEGSTRSIHYTFNNALRYGAFKKRLMPILREAKLRCSLLDKKPWRDNERMTRSIKTVFEDPSIEDLSDPAKFTTEMMQALAFLADNYSDKEAEIKLLCADHYRSDFLEYRP